MPERDSVNDAIEFIELIDRETEDRLDPGIRLFDTMTTESETFINLDGGVTSPRCDAALDGLNDEWGFRRDIATLSGRLYLCDAFLKDYLVKDWGEVFKDEDGETYFLVSDVELRSQGIVKGPHDYAFEAEEAIQNRVRFGYGFSLPQDDIGLHQFVLYPGEASQHVYGTPSPEAMDLRLHRDWPQVMELVDRLIGVAERDTNKLPRRLAILTRRIQSELLASEDLREWLAHYIDTRIAFDERWSVALTMKGPISFIDDEDDMIALNISENHTEHCFKPEVAFILKETDDQRCVHAAFVADFPHHSDESYTDRAIIPVTSVYSLRSTRRIKSLLEVAMQADYAADEDEQTANVSKIDNQLDNPSETQEAVNIQRAIDAIITDMIVSIRQIHRRHTFSSAEAAKMAAERLCEDALSKLKQLSAHQVPLRVRGESVTMPNVTAQPDIEENSFRLGLNPDVPYGAPCASDELIGYFHGLIAAVDEVENGEETSYLPMVKMLVDLGMVPIEMAHNPVPLIAGEVRKRAIVRMDTFNHVRPAQLELIDDFRDSYKALKQKYKNHQILEIISHMNRTEVALARDNTKYTELQDVSVLRKFSKAIKADPVVATDALEVVTKMLKLATAKLTGDVYSSGNIIHDYEIYGAIEAVVEHVPSDPESGVAFALHVRHEANQPIYYVPLRSVTKFLY